MECLALEVIDYSIEDLDWWKNLMALFLKEGENFQIRCWRDKKEIIEKALGCGKLCLESSSQCETSIRGLLGKELIDYIALEEKPEEYDRWTNFFTINIGERFSSSHYGSEIWIHGLENGELENIREIINPFKEYFSLE